MCNYVQMKVNLSILPHVEVGTFEHHAPNVLFSKAHIANSIYDDWQYSHHHHTIEYCLGSKVLIGGAHDKEFSRIVDGCWIYVVAPQNLQMLGLRWILYTQSICYIANLDEDVVVARARVLPPIIPHYLPLCHGIMLVAQGMNGSYTWVACMRTALLLEIARLLTKDALPNHTAPSPSRMYIKLQKPLNITIKYIVDITFEA